MRRASIRLRLTAQYSALVAATGIALLAILYVAMRTTLPSALAIVLDTDKVAATVQPSTVTTVPTDPATSGSIPTSSEETGMVVGETGTEGTIGSADISLLDNLGDAAFATLLRWSVLALAVLLVISVLVGWIAAGRMLAPLRQMTATAAQMSARTLTERFELTGPHDELRELGDTFDRMLDRVEAAFDSERRLIATVSHELRTPLATQRAVLEVAFDPPGGEPTSPEVSQRAGLAAIEQNIRATQIIDAMATLARVENTELQDVADVALLPVLQDAVAAVADKAATLGVEIEIDCAPRLSIAANPALLERLVANLVGNAVVHNVPAGHVWVSASLEHPEAADASIVSGSAADRGAGGGSAGDGGGAGLEGHGEGRDPGERYPESRAVVLRVSNTGAPLTDLEVGELTLPFRRGGRDRTGSRDGQGLGLTIVAAVARAHDADLTLTARPGGGLDAMVRWAPGRGA